ncbi:MAG: guanylate kinase [Alicyclobacillaceae bacterium]|nr:guanylate kinase [Alicyclobacillaceae bacterium]
MQHPASTAARCAPNTDASESVVQFNPRYRRDREGIIFVISGPSGAGKNTLINQVKNLDLGVHYIPSFTTRALRPGESQGNPYYFVDLQAFQEMAARQEFLEFEQIHGNYYGTHAKTYEYAIRHGYDAIKDIDVKGAMNFKRRFPGHVVLIYVRPTSLDDLAGRLVMRGDSREDIAVRMGRLHFEESKRSEFDYVIYNDDLETAKNQLVDIIRRVCAAGHLVEGPGAQV